MFIRTLWLSMSQPVSHAMSVVIRADTANKFTASMGLNNAQQCAVEGVVGDRPIVVVQGGLSTVFDIIIDLPHKLFQDPLERERRQLSLPLQRYGACIHVQYGLLPSRMSQ